MPIATSGTAPAAQASAAPSPQVFHASRPANPSSPSPRPFSVDEYQRLLRGGVLRDIASIELLEGVIVARHPAATRHDAALDKAHKALRRAFTEDWRVRSRCALATGDSVIEADLVVHRGPVLNDPLRFPLLADVLLVVEVSDQSLGHDRDARGRVYARAAIANYWIVNLLDALIEAHAEPSGSREFPCYYRRHAYRGDEAIPIPIHGQPRLISARELLP
jgi:Uma2 family endonuclease